MRQARTATSRLARPASMPRVWGREAPPVPGPSRACTSTSRGRRPWRTGTTALPGTPAMRSPSMSGPGSGTARRPSSRISKMPTSPVGPKRCLTEVRTRSVWWRSPSKESTVSTRCSTARGPARSPSLVTCPTRSSGTPLDFAMRVRRSTQARTWARLPAGWASSGSETDWSESTTSSAGWWRSTAASISSDVGPLQREQVTGHQADARRPPAHLGERLLGGGEHDVDAGGGHRREHLEEQGRLADPGRAEQQGDRARDHAAAQDAVELADTGRQRLRRRPSRRRPGRRRRPRPRPHPVAPTGPAPTTTPNVFHAPQLGHRPTQRSDVASHAVQR